MTALAKVQDVRSRARAKIRGTSVTSRTALLWLLIGLIPLAALFVAVGFWRTWTTAYLLLIGVMPPAQAAAGLVGVLLSLAGYALVPLVIGTAVAGLFNRVIERASAKDFKAEVQREVQELLNSGKYIKAPEPSAGDQAGGAAL